MTKREIIIVSLMGIAAVGAAVDFLVSGGRDADAGGSAATDPSTIVAQVRGGLASLRFDPVRGRILERTDTAWRDDLFYPGEAAPSTPPAETANESENRLPAYTGYLNIDGTALAIVDGRDYTEGEWLEDGSFEILSLSPDRIELRPPQGESTIFVEIEKHPFTW